MMFPARWMKLFVLLGLCACAQGSTSDPPKADDSAAARTKTNVGGDSATASQDGHTGAANGDPRASAGGAGTSAQPPASNATATKRVFITSVKYTGNLDGIDGADSKCNKSAKLAQLGGTWKAWMSSSDKDAVQRIKDVGPWFTVDEKTKMYENIFDLIGKALAIDRFWLDELGNPVVGQVEVWTGTENGKGNDDDCEEWTSSESGGTSTTLEDGESGGSDCGDPLPLLCVEQ
jgi:hypothetical protein